jgi:hypothetical protein
MSFLPKATAYARARSTDHVSPTRNRLPLAIYAKSPDHNGLCLASHTGLASTVANRLIHAAARRDCLATRPTHCARLPVKMVRPRQKQELPRGHHGCILCAGANGTRPHAPLSPRARTRTGARQLAGSVHFPRANLRLCGRCQDANVCLATPNLLDGLVHLTRLTDRKSVVVPQYFRAASSLSRQYLDPTVLDVTCPLTPPIANDPDALISHQPLPTAH